MMLTQSREIKSFRHLVSTSVTKVQICLCWHIAGSDFFCVKVTEEASTGFPPSPGFPEASTAKALR